MGVDAAGGGFRRAHRLWQRGRWAQRLARGNERNPGVHASYHVPSPSAKPVLPTLSLRPAPCMAPRSCGRAAPQVCAPGPHAALSWSCTQSTLWWTLRVFTVWVCLQVCCSSGASNGTSPASPLGRPAPSACMAAWRRTPADGPSSRTSPSLWARPPSCAVPRWRPKRRSSAYEPPSFRMARSRRGEPPRLRLFSRYRVRSSFSRCHCGGLGSCRSHTPANPFSHR